MGEFIGWVVLAAGVEAADRGYGRQPVAWLIVQCLRLNHELLGVSRG